MKKLFVAITLLVAGLIANRTNLEKACEALAKRNALLRSLFPNQLAAVRDLSSKKCIWTTGRAGKTTCVITDFLIDGLQHERYRYAYIALTRPSAEDIAWPIIKELNIRYNLGCKLIASKLKVILPTGSIITLYGADKPNFMDRLYGQKLRKVAIDESAFFSIDLRKLVTDHLEPRVTDLQGQIYLMSIPGHLPIGLFDDIIKGFSPRENLSGVASKTVPGWSVHRWTTFDNPHMVRQFSAKIAELKAENPDIENDPGFRRNYYGERVTERGESVYKFDPEKNTYQGKWTKSPGDHFVLGIDFGWDDYQAFSLNVWRDDSPLFVELESHRKKHMLLDEVYSWVKLYQDWCGEDLTIVADAAHKQLFEEFRRRFDVPVIPAEKAQKFDWIAIYNTDLTAGTIKVVDPAQSPHVEEMIDLKWKVKLDGWKVEQPGQKNDCCDAELVAYRHSYHYRHKEPEPDISKMQREEASMLAAVQTEMEEEEGAWNDY